MKRLAITTLAMSAISLSGCAQVMNFGDMMWSETKHTSYQSGQKLASLLRPRAARQEPVFVQSAPVQARAYAYGAYESTPQLRTQASAIRTSDIYGQYASAEVEVFQPVQAQSEFQTKTYGRTAKQAQTYTQNGYQPYSQTQGSYQDIHQADVYAAPPAEPVMPDLSYVKLSGSTSIADWQACQSEAGGYIQPVGDGFEIRSDFDYCMRMKGYIPERDAIAFMDSQTLP